MECVLYCGLRMTYECEDDGWATFVGYAISQGPVAGSACVEYCKPECDGKEW